MNLSIIIPTLNEEDYLPLLLESIKKQNFAEGEEDKSSSSATRATAKGGEEGILFDSLSLGESLVYEVIVADARSQDKTAEIAKSYGCKVVPGGCSPAAGRNEGAKIAKGDLLLFLDADTILPERSLENFIGEFKKRNLDIAGFLLRPVGKNKFIKLLYDLFYNWLILMVEKISSHSGGVILIKKEIHEKIGGFNEEIKLGEDSDYMKRTSKFGKFGILKSTRIFYSQRRFANDGWARTYFKYVLCGLHIFFFGPVKTDIFNYRFGHYKKSKSKTS